RDHRCVVRDALPRRLQPAVHVGRRLRAAGQPRRGPPARRGSRPPARRLPREGAGHVELPDPRALVAAAVPVGPAAALRMEVHAAAGARQSRGDGGGRMGSPGARVKTKRYRRKAYWNRPTMSWWEKAYL